MIDARIEWNVLLSDGSEVCVLANDPAGAIQEALERGYYQPVNATVAE